MSDTSLAAVKVAPETTEVRELPVPELPIDGALMRVESAGVCGSDPGAYRRRQDPCIMGHENAGTIVKIGPMAEKRWGIGEGARVVVEEYLPCWRCDHCLAGDFRLCAAGKVGSANSRRYGHTGIDVAPGLWGGFSQYVYLPANAVVHPLADHISFELASLAVPISNGIEWAVNDGGARPGRRVLVIGPGQQGLGAVLAAHAYGADQIILVGGASDSARLEMGLKLGADAVVNLDEIPFKEAVLDLTDGVGVDVVVDTSDYDESVTVRDALAAAATDRGATIVISGGGTYEFPFAELKRKYATIKAYRGHSYQSVDRALHYIGSGNYPLEQLCTHRFGLNDVHTAIRATAGQDIPNAIHVTVDPWMN